MAWPNRATYAPVANQFQPIRVSVSSEASAGASTNGPFRGFMAIVSTSFTLTGPNGKTLPIDNLAKNTVLWVQGYVSTLNASAATATVTAANTTDILFGVF